MIVVDVCPGLAGHLAVAMHQHRRQMLGAGVPMPHGFDELLTAFTDAAKSRQDPTALDRAERAAEAVAVPLRLLTTAQVATTLGVSERAVERLLAAGDLTAVRVGDRTTRVRVDDLNAYVASLPTTKGRAA